MPTIHDLDTPAVLIDVDRAEANIARAQAHADRHGQHLRPHVKTHKLPYWAGRQMAAGAVGITCQKIGEAEVMADAGLTDIFLPYNILGRTKLERLLALHRRITLSVTVDNAVALDGLAAAFTDPGHRLEVLVECDTGMGRCGVQNTDEAVTLARGIAAARGLSFGGLMTYPANGQPGKVETWLRQARDALAASGFDCRRISSGGTPDMWRTGRDTVITEYRPGTYIYMDRSQVRDGAATLDNCALTVLATVVSHPTAARAIVDAGSKALSSDTLGLSDFGEVQGMPGATVSGLSEEHGKLLLSGSARLSVGERVRLVPNHCCVVVNLFDKVHLISGEKVLETLPVAARGRSD